MGNNKKSGNSLVSFGKAGWGTIIFCNVLVLRRILYRW